VNLNKRHIASLKDFIRLIRPYQYTKNLFIFLPAFFSGELIHGDVLKKCSLSFASFCMVASAIYIFNDIMDANEDRLHPTKRYRPIASLQVSQKNGYVLISVFLIIGFLVSCLNRGLPQLLFLYLVLNILYSYKLKHVAIVDITIIALGFVIRLFAGSVVTNILLTKWIEIMTFLLALFLGFAKRRDDVLICQNNIQRARKSIDGYNLEFINVSTAVIAGVILVAYIMYTLSPEIILKFKSDKLYLTALFVVLGILRYLQLTYVENKSGSPTEILLRDRFLQIVLLCWVASFGILLYS
jgi:decaprenyl-phosphate phosphoribosyltransferase